MLDPKAFKAYDVRGLYPPELDEAGAYAIGRAFVEQFEPRPIAVGRDMRLSSPSMAAAVIEGAADARRRRARPRDGRHGDGLFRGRRARRSTAASMVTASHNPKQYTGMKIVRRGALPVGGESGLLDVRDRAVAAAWREAARGRIAHGGHLGAVRRPGALVRRPGRAAAAAGRHRRRERDGRRDAAAGARAAADGRRRALLLRARTGRSRTTSRTRSCPRTASSSSRKTREEGADFGVAYDGDADRCFFVDDTGEFVPGDFTTALFAETILAREPGGKVIYDVRASWAVPRDDRARRRRAADQPRRPRVHQAAHARGGRGVRRRGVGALLLPRLLAGRLGTVPFLLMCELVSRRGKLSEMLAPFRARYFITGEINTPVADVPREAAGAEGALRRRRPGLAPRRPLGRRRRLALQRAPVEHGAAAPPEPRSALARS